MNHSNDINRIQILLDRFFDSETSLAEEKELEQFFAASGQLPPHLAPYREMFGWYAAGMPEELPSALEPAEEKAEPRLSPAPWRRRFLAWGAAAAVAIIIIAIGWSYRAEKITGYEDMYAESYVVRDGLVISGTEEVQTEIDAAMLDMQILLMELDEAENSLTNNPF